MDVIFFAFANSQKDPLTTLEEEDTALYKMLSPRALKQHFMLHRESFATIESVAHYIAQFRNNLVLFLYSGHAERDKLVLGDTDAHAEGIAHLLGQCPKLKLVFLNGCSTKGQVAELLDKGIPAVLATSAPVDDRKASDFSRMFFTALNDQASIEEAFELAKGELMTKYQDVKPEVHSGLVEWGAEEKEESLWGLYTGEDKGDVLRWKLPFEVQIADAETFEPNQLLIDTLLDALAPYREDVAKIIEEESLGAEKSVLDKREAILKALPHPVSEQFRKLLVDDDPGDGKVTFYHKVGADRLKQILVIYNTLLELITYIVLAQLWEVMSKQEVQLSQKDADELRGFFTLSTEDRDKYNFMRLIAAVRRTLDANDTPYFIQELSALAKAFDEEAKLRDAMTSLEQMKNKVKENAFDSQEANQMCIVAEQKLADMMHFMGFLANYTLASVKDIDVLNFRHFKAPKYKHSIVILEQRFVGLAENQEIADKLMDCKSVLVIKNGEKTGYLNLSPFVIDENAFDAKASLAKLYFFDRYDRAANAYAFKHVYKPTDAPLVIQQQKHFQILKAQFDAFAQSVFRQPMNAL